MAVKIEGFRKNALLIIGPGHSGTKYLAGVCESLGYETMHEQTDEYKHKFLDESYWREAGDWLDSGDRALVGHLFSFMVHYMRYRIQDIPVVCTHRMPQDLWVDRMGGEASFHAARGLPRGTVDFAHYWEMYENLARTVTEPVLHMEMYQLDDAPRLICDFLGGLK